MESLFRRLGRADRVHSGNLALCELRRDTMKTKVAFLIFFLIALIISVLLTPYVVGPNVTFPLWARLITSLGGALGLTIIWKYF